MSSGSVFRRADAANVDPGLQKRLRNLFRMPNASSVFYSFRALCLFVFFGWALSVTAFFANITNDKPNLRRTHADELTINAIGDLHGDIHAALRALRLAGVVGLESDTWLPGVRTTVVQLGDQIDRLPYDRAVLELFSRLAVEAAKEGGRLVSLIGDHEILNTELSFEYVHKGAFSAFAGNALTPAGQAAIAELNPAVVARKDARFGPDVWRGRAASFSLNGPMRALLSTRPLVYRQGATLFVHAGLLETLTTNRDGEIFGVHTYADAEHYSEELQKWLQSGKPRSIPPWVGHPESPIWTRKYGEDVVKEEDCSALRELLMKLECARAVIGHTVQRDGANSACDDALWRIDVGLAEVYGLGRQGMAEVLSIIGGQVSVLRGGDGEGASSK